MPIITRSKRRIQIENENLEKQSKLTDITNKKTSKMTSKSKNAKEIEEINNNMNLAQQDTIKIQLISSCVANKKRKASQKEEAIEFAKKSRSGNLNEVSGNESQNTAKKFVEMMRQVKLMLENNFKNVAERLQLDPVPSCLYDLKKCNNIHNPKNSINTISNTLKTTILDALENDSRLWRFTHNIRHNILGHNIFPGAEILSKVLEKILKLCPDMQEFNINFMLRELHSIFADIVDKFPPCHIRDRYLKVFKTKVSFEGIKEQNHLLPTILDQLSESIFNRQTKINVVKKYDEDVIFNFEAWDQHQQNETFINFPTNDKFERLFLVLDLIVRILEHDASVFIIKYSYKFASSIANDRLKPLICSVIWQDHESVIVINSIIKQLISIFVAMTALKYPADKIKIVSRLLSLVSHVINMYEYPNDTFQYPSYQNYSIDFAREIQRCVENSTYYSVQLHHHVVENIRAPLIQMLLTNFMMSKVTGKTNAVSLSIPLELICKKEFEKYEDIPRKVLKKGNDRYPKYEDTSSRNKYTLVQSDYLQILLNYTKAVDNYYCISTAAVSYLNDNSKTVQVNEDKLVLRKVDLNFKKMVHIRFTNESCGFYRDEIKHLLLLSKYIKNLHSKYGSSLDAWMKFVQKIQAEN